MADIEKSIAECCKQLKLSTNFAGQAYLQKGDTPQEYLLNLLTNEIEYRTAKRKSKFLNTAGFPRRYRVCQTAHCGRRKPHFDFGEVASPIVPYRHLPQTLRWLTADCRSLV